MRKQVGRKQVLVSLEITCDQNHKEKEEEEEEEVYDSAHALLYIFFLKRGKMPDLVLLKIMINSKK